MTKIHSLRIKIKGPGLIYMIIACYPVVVYFWSVETWHKTCIIQKFAILERGAKRSSGKFEKRI